MSAAGARRGLVLGAGGRPRRGLDDRRADRAAEAEGFDPREADIIIGTSAGSVLAALLGCGLGRSTLRSTTSSGVRLPREPAARAGTTTATTGGRAAAAARGSASARPRLLLRTAARTRGRCRPWRRSRRSCRRGAARCSRWAGWSTPSRPGRRLGAARRGLWIVAMDYDAGRRAVFGRPARRRATLAEAVTASCAIPGWYAPVVIDDRRYVDGGTLLADLARPARGRRPRRGLRAGADGLASPTTSRARRSPPGWSGGCRRLVTRRAAADAETVRRSGTSVTVLGPGPEDLEAIGANLMDPRRRQAVLETSLRTSVAALRAAARTPPYGPGRWADAGLPAGHHHDPARARRHRRARRRHR